MRNPLLIVLFFTLGVLFAEAQVISGMVNYKVAFLEEEHENTMEVLKKDQVDVASIYGAFMDKMNSDIKKVSELMSYKLEFNLYASLFEVKATPMSIDENIDFNLINAVLMANGKYYTNINKNESIREFTELDKNWLVEDGILDYKWQVLQDTKVILGYTCYKAVSKYSNPIFGESEIVAWFTPDIPLNFGPIEYYGLPGLILEVNRDSYSFYATEINLSKDEKEVKKPKKGERHNRASFDLKINELNQKLRGGY